jgi:transposase InsO family protein
MGDITEVWTEEGWLYLSALVDVYSRTVVGWAMDVVRDEQLVENALWMALVGCQPEAGLLHHSDRGSHTPEGRTSRAYQAVLTHYGIELRVSRKTNCWDNALMESFFGTLKTECVDRQSYQTRGKAKTVIFEYTSVFYNRPRLHSSLVYLSPEKFEATSPSHTL